MAWTRTALALMAFGFVIERFGLFLHMFVVTQAGPPRRDASFWVGVSFIVLGAIVALVSVLQYRNILKTLKPVEIPDAYWVNIGVYTNLLATFSSACDESRRVRR
jgi:putative membrane protein